MPVMCTVGGCGRLASKQPDAKCALCNNAVCSRHATAGEVCGKCMDSTQQPAEVQAGSMKVHCAVQCLMPVGNTTLYATLLPAPEVDIEGSCPLAPGLHEDSIPDPREQKVSAVVVPPGGILVVSQCCVGGVACSPLDAEPVGTSLWTWHLVPESRPMVDPSVLEQCGWIHVNDTSANQPKQTTAKKRTLKDKPKKAEETDDEAKSYSCRCLQVCLFAGFAFGCLCL